MNTLPVRARKSSRAHPRNQIKYRFGIEISIEELNELEKKIEYGHPDVLYETCWYNRTGQRELYLAVVRDTVVYAVYNRKRRSVSTFWDEKRRQEVMEEFENERHCT